MAVVASLVYLAVQVRQNTRLVQSAVDQAQTDGHGRYLALLAQEADLARICLEGMASRPLEGEEAFRFSWLMHDVFAQVQSAYFHRRNGIISAHQWETPSRVAARWLDAPGVRDWWSREKGIFRDEFVRWVDGELAAGPDRASDPRKAASG